MSNHRQDKQYTLLMVAKRVYDASPNLALARNINGM